MSGSSALYDNQIDNDEALEGGSSSSFVVPAESLSIETYLRIKPCPDISKEELAVYGTESVTLDGRENKDFLNLEIPIEADPGLLHNNSYSGLLQFQFDRIFDVNTSQTDIFTAVAKNKVDAVFEGINSTILAYGQTGSGKTYSIFGGDKFSERGIIPRTINYIFASMKEKRKTGKFSSFHCKISFTEIYQEVIYDLLDTQRKTSIESFPTVQLYESEDGVLMKNLNVFEVSSEDEALQLFFLGNGNRITSSTFMNNASSRSHAIFTIIIDTEGIVDERTVFTSGKINLVDLAGSERMYKLPNTKGMIKEAKAINLSLHYLEQVIVTLRENIAQNKHAQKRTFVPYRNSVLTNMLRDSLGGNCKSCFLLTITPQKSHFEETVATCRFGQRCGEIKVTVSRNTEIGLNDQLKDLTQRVKVLERKLAITEENKKNLEIALRAEQELRVKQTELRNLTEQEKLTCKGCVQELLAAAKESLAILDIDNAKEISEQIIEHSQDVLYNAVEVMDKTVLVELSTALGGLVQSMYIEREMSKREEVIKEEKRKQTEEDARQKKMKEMQELEILQRGNHVELESLKRLPDSIVAKIIKGSVFIKHGRFGKKSARFIQISEDLSTLLWRDVIDKKMKSSDHFPISDFDSVERHSGVTELMFTLHAKPGRKSLILEYTDSDGSEGLMIWLDALRFLILHH